MSSLTNINNNTRVVNVGRTTPVAPGQQPSSKSIPVVLASDQTAIPVEEQNKVQSEVSLSLLGIPRAEVALGIFADVNTYDVNPSEWSSSPQYYNTGHGIKHLPNEAGALVEAPRDQFAVLTSKRFFRYQPGRVSAATFGIKSSVSTADFALNPVIRKYGIFDNFDGYYWETKQSGQGDNFTCVRRTQSMLKFPTSPFGLPSELMRKPSGVQQDTPVPYEQTDDYRAVGKEGIELKGKYFVRERQILADYGATVGENAWDAAIANNGALDTYYQTLSGDAAYDFKDKCHRDVTFMFKMIMMDLEWGSNAHTRLNTKNYYTGLFPAYPGGNDPAELEIELHLEALNILTSVAGLPAGSGTAVEKIGTLYDVFLKNNADLDAAVGSDDGFFVRIAKEQPATGGTESRTGATRVFQNEGYKLFTGSGTGMSFGDKKVIDTLFDARKHYWSYFVSSFKPTFANINSISAEASIYSTGIKQTYTFRGAANYLPTNTDGSPAYNEQLIGQELSGADYPFAPGDNVGAVSLTEIDAVALNEFYRNIKYKCARDLEYIITGYKNDIAGGGNAETIYNASMYYKASGLSIFTQTDAGTPSDTTIPREIEKHKHLRKMIHDDLSEATAAIDFGNQSAARERLEELSTIIVDNFTTETTEGANLGNRGFAGNIIAFRDGLLMVHAAVNDPNLMKERKKILATYKVARTDSQPTVFKLAEGGVTFGQKVRVTTPTAETEISTSTSAYKSSDGTIINQNEATVPSDAKLKAHPYDAIYTVSRVYGPTGSEFSLQDQDGVDVYAHRDNTDGTDGSGSTDPVNTLNTEEVRIETVVPFIGDNIYSSAVYRDATTRPEGTVQNISGQSVQTPFTEGSDTFPIGMQWPLKYSSTGDINDGVANFIGHIDTSLSPKDSNQIETIRKQYDTIIFNPEYINWIKNNVKPEFWGVYEYRVPRSRFSHDKLDGKVSRRVYSDLATGPSGIVRPGMDVVDEAGLTQEAISEYEFDFTKVTMLKIEFSWYGAVGALFLAYVPIGNGEARWVRVHHLRASNQLKIASLGNATLPITYNVFGGGSPLQLGDGENAQQNYSSTSHNIVKYGASYYIDGGDRGTVRLYSHNNNDVIPGYGKQWEVLDITGSQATGTTTPRGYEISLTGINTIHGGAINIPNDKVYFMGAEVKTSNPSDTGIKVVWVEGDVITLSKQPTGNGLILIPDRANLVYGLETKDVIYSTVQQNPVRNRVQVYPTKLSTANLQDNPVRLRMKRTPLFQTNVVPSGGPLTLNGDYIVSPTNDPISIDAGDAGYLANGESLYGWFKGLIGEVEPAPIFGRLYKASGQYYFEILETYNESVTLIDNCNFLPDARFFYQSDSNVSTTSNETAQLQPLADTLTSINVVANTVVPIPNTGTNIATLYMTGGTEQVDLNTYFDYNKEYLSYPLTDEAETLYFAIDSDQKIQEDENEIAIGLTWEEQ